MCLGWGRRICLHREIGIAALVPCVVDRVRSVSPLL